MSVASAITNARNKIAAIYAKVSDRGGTLPTTQDLENLPTAIDSIPSGGGAFDFLSEIGASDAAIAKLNEINNERLAEEPTYSARGSAIAPFLHVTDIPANFYYSEGSGKQDILVADAWTGSDMQTFMNCCGLRTLIVGDGTYVKKVASNAYVYCFNACYALKNIVCILDFENRTDISSYLWGCYCLTYVRIKNLGFSWKASGYNALDYGSLLYLVQNLKSGVDSLTLTLGSTHLAKLTATDEGNAAIAEAQEKGWTIA